MKFGSFTYDNDDERNDDKKAAKSAAASRGDFTPSYDMKGTAFIGGQSQKEAEEQAYVRDYGDQTMPKESKSERERREALQAEAQGNSGQQKGSQVSQEQPRQQQQPRLTSEAMQSIRNAFRNQVAKTSAEVGAALDGPLKGMRSLDGLRESRRINAENSKSSAKDLATAFKAAGTKPREGQTVVEALRERQAQGNDKPITDRNGNTYALRDDKLVISDRNGKELKSMSAAEAHKRESDADKAKGLKTDQGLGMDR
ncbi:hypothetical protein NKY66_10830 [Sinorhizobium meliloti]|uniref:hypothetical protein n=1 Tax=Rhizobium meliloti TaxID=382 RepID=UPI003D65F826